MTERPHRTSRAAALLFGTLLVLAVTNFPAAAQNPPPAGNPIEAQIQQLRQLLHITPAQENNFDAFAAAWRGNATTMRALFQQRPAGVNMSAVESLRFEQKLAAANAAGLQRLIGPFTRLYASFSPAQKQVANRIFSPRPATPGRG
jgi:protein CpxP